MIFDFPKKFRFADSHEYACPEGDLVRIGISAFAVDQLGDIVFVDLPGIGTLLEQGISFGSVESVKAVEDMNAPIGGEVLQINESVLNSPEELQNDPHGEGWLLLVKPSDASQLDKLMSSEIYSEKVSSK
ncbi:MULTISPECIES: glycine cleavage system protein GcvH [Prochlorococcus]|uniref:Glycine cleavage system H protein n=1 Tax=Prochlorococcus marinus (strain SARG / CCMP1375 / SS120) TaxID=167539 RepID=GCSH_PROMA|nr:MULTISPECIES: glycine cleavage system protein GcvH [Prochlorococcus]Q7V9K3.1 RecName: Full=Glycine cleavage system H protein [Prochlorococcus marinus subsp. marinus str. CCMP1375]AAQ00874.1 Glycine cleavage system H protein [Prochlorococcus marinus subsp. marinus str. CCMP1375]KGG10632.1 Glycine cleavage system H protein [Prochlorococcus marinus str. LG]KGG19902.1 Glycine cleavage system H protein [Prochlorococcus marinus str. SS2]KGG23878.1 Glycine cleavage system H protein [Prochlorococcu